MSSILILRKPKSAGLPPPFLQGAQQPVSPGFETPFVTADEGQWADDYFGIGTPLSALQMPPSTTQPPAETNAATEEQWPSVAPLVQDSYTVTNVDTSAHVASCKVQIKNSVVADSNVYDILPRWAPPHRSDSWPDRTNVVCWHCVHPFETRPVPLVLTWTVREGFRSMGCFCSFNCAKAYMQDTRGIDALKILPHNAFFFNQYRHINDARESLPDAYHLIPRAPPRQTLAIFGGPKTILEFRADSTNIQVKYHLIPRPMTVFNSQLLREEILNDISSTVRGEGEVGDGLTVPSAPGQQTQRKAAATPQTQARGRGRGRRPRVEAPSPAVEEQFPVRDPSPPAAGKARRKRRREDTHVVVEDDDRRAEKVRKMINGRPKTEKEPAVKLHLEAFETNAASAVNLQLATRMEEAEQRRIARAVRSLGGGEPSAVDMRAVVPNTLRAKECSILKMLGATLAK